MAGPLVADPIRVVQRRGEFAESMHLVHAVAVRGDTVVAAAGDSIPCSLRSSAKPFQALSVVRAREDLDDADVAIACASHDAEPAQLEAAAVLLAKAGATEAELACGFDPRNGGRGLSHNCSGKHAGMLAACAARGWPSDGYHRADHPLQREIAATVAEATGADAATGVDGCGVVAFSVRLVDAARMFSRLDELDGGERVIAAMAARPQLVGGERAGDTHLMRAFPGTVAKRGAEGAFGIRFPDGTGVFAKVADGAGRAVRPALHSFLRGLGYDVPEWRSLPVRNSRDETVGELAADV